MVNKDLLRFYREDNDLTYDDLAKELKCPKKIIELWERGELVPREDDIKKLAKLYNISPKDLYSINYTKNNLLSSIILLLLGIVSGLIVKNYGVSIMAAISFIVFYRLIIVLQDYERKDDVPKSLFGYNLLNGYMSLYLLEANIIASGYTIINVVLRLFKINMLVLNIDIVSSNDLNTLLIMGVSYILLMILSFIIEYIFGNMLLKEYKDVR